MGPWRGPAAPPTPLVLGISYGASPMEDFPWGTLHGTPPWGIPHGISHGGIPHGISHEIPRGMGDFPLRDPPWGVPHRVFPKQVWPRGFSPN